MRKKGYLGALGALTLLGCLLGSYVPAAYAEGSNDLVSSGGDRPYLEFWSGLNGGIPRRTIIKVYANEGETINLGSSAVGRGNGTINYRRPNGTSGSCGTVGLIANRTQEQNGPGNPGGFTPCTVTVGAGQAGIWEIDFVSPADAGVNPPNTGGTGWVSPQPNNVGYVSAWDVTVKSSTGTAIPGRVYANYYALNMGGNNRALSSTLRVLTLEGFQYSVDLNNLDPFGFIFFANRNGFYDTATDEPIFRSLQFTGPNPGQLPSGYAFQNPNDPDSGGFVTHKTFINPPDVSMPAFAASPAGTTWLYNLPVPSPAPTGFSFEGIEGTNGQAGTNPLGGTLSFDSSVPNSYAITIDLNRDNIYGNGNDRTFLGRAEIGNNSVTWDGLDGNGARVAAGNIPYNVQINLYAGEAHFPMIDAEQNPNGIIIRLENQPPGPVSSAYNANSLYYDDRNTGTDFTVCAGGETGVNCYGGAPNPRQALLGIDSSSGAHAFFSNFGDRRGIDTWVYYPSADVSLAGGILLREADLVVDKTVSLANANVGDELTYTVTVTNDGPSDEPGIGFTDVVPDTLYNVSWSCAITSGTGSCSEDSGTGNNIDTTVDLNDQAVAAYTITATIVNTASGTITNSATASRNVDITDPDETNNTDDAVTVISPGSPFADLLLVKRITAVNGQSTNPNDGTALNQFVDNTALPAASADNYPNWPANYLVGAFDAGVIQPGDELEYTVYFLSSGNLAAEDVRLCDRLSPNQTFVLEGYGTGRDIELQLGTSPVIGLTAASDASDRTEFIAPGAPVPATCNLQGANDDGTLMIDITGATGTGEPTLTTLPASTGPGTPNNAYGFFRFKTQVTP